MELLNHISKLNRKIYVTGISFAFILCFLIAGLFVCSGCNNNKSNNDVTIGIAGITKASEFYLYAREAAESTGAKVVDLDLVMPSYINYEITPKEKKYLSKDVEKIFKENGYGSTTYYDVDLKDKDDCGGLLYENAVKLAIYSYSTSNINKIMEGIDAVIIPGGEDISPGILFNNPTGQSKESDFQAANDVSDVLLTRYCLENDIPILGICRGMQMMSVVRGGSVIDDIKDFYISKGMDPEGAKMHRMENTSSRFFVPHDVKIINKIGQNYSKLYQILGTEEIKNVPSWHHQLIREVDKSPLYVSCVAPTYGHDFIESVELPTNKFAIGVQFHVEVPIYLANHNDSRLNQFMDIEQSKKIFQALVEAAKTGKR